MSELLELSELMSNIPKKIKKYIKKTHNGIYDFNNSCLEYIIKDIQTNLLLDDSYINLIKRILAKYSFICNNKLFIDVHKPTHNNLSIFNIITQQINPSSDPLYHEVNLTPYLTTNKPAKQEINISHELIKKRTDTFLKLQSIEYPPQRSPGWYLQRDGKITASDAGTVIGENKYEQPYKMILKKLRETFQNNEFTYHGKKYELIATLIYEYRFDVHTEEFGMVGHEQYNFLGASPDGIVSQYKRDCKTLTNLVGRMLEIKVPLRRKINTEGDIKDNICPIYYWDQTQLQMECCDLDECDFWQCCINEYPSESLFISDTDPNNRHISKSKGLEKGCLVQILPLDKLNLKDKDYLDAIFSSAQFIHPTKLDMNPEECKIWLEDTIKKIPNTHPGYGFDKIKYWYLDKSFCVTIYRNKEWFKSNVLKYQQMWDDITFMRSNEKNKDLFLYYMDKYKYPEKEEKLYEKLKNEKIFEKKKNELMYDIISKLRLYQNNDTKLDEYIKYMKLKLK
jgi:putative phage-type endonuclease